jgi:hypothetical protein
MTGFCHKVNPLPFHFIEPFRSLSYPRSTIEPNPRWNALVTPLPADPVSGASILSHTVTEVLPLRFEDQYDL